MIDENLGPHRNFAIGSCIKQLKAFQPVADQSRLEVQILKINWVAGGVGKRYFKIVQSAAVTA